MSGTEFDMTKLVQFSEFNAAKAEKNFVSRSVYFNELENFLKNGANYLHAYTPAVVIFSDDVRAEFLAELEQKQKSLADLEMDLALPEIENLKKAVFDSNVKELSDGLIKFSARMKILVNCLAQARAEDGAQTPQNEKPLVLAVDDEPENLVKIMTALRDAFEIVVVSDAALAMKLVPVLSPAMLLLDVDMPGINGCDLAESVHKQKEFKNLPVLFLANHSDKEHIMEAISHGANDFILKSADGSLLLQKVTKHMRCNV